MESNDVGHLHRLGIDVDQLETEINAAICKDTRYWLENSTKIRAVEQGVPTYEHFRQMVAGCHLRPLDKTELIGLRKPKSTWNQAGLVGAVPSHPIPAIGEPEFHQIVTSPQKFYSIWGQLQREHADTSDDRLSRLSCFALIQSLKLFQSLFQSGLGTTLLPDLLAAFNYAVSSPYRLSSLAMTEEEIVEKVAAVVRVFCESSQFHVAVQFLSVDEKEIGRRLCHHIQTKISSNQEEILKLFKKAFDD